MIIDVPLKKEPGSNGFAVQFYLTFKEEITPMSFKLYQKKGEN